MQREQMLNELTGLYKKLEELKKKRAQKEQMLDISEKIKHILESLVEELDDYSS